MHTIRRLYRILPKEIHYLRTTLESYDGAAVVSTLDAREGIVEVRVAPGSGPLVEKIIRWMQEQEGLAVEPLGSGDKMGESPSR